jgi:cytochrome P450
MPWLPVARKAAAARAALDTIIYRIIAERRASGDRGDLLSMLLGASDEAETMSDEQVRDEAITMFTAGHETTANALTWTWALLGQTPTAAARMRAEIDAVLGKRSATMADVEALAYTRDVFSEAMRLYPPAWVVSRLAMQPVEVGGYALETNSIVITSPYASHRNAKYFDDPLVFRPERWAEIRPTLPKFAYFPFGGGNRRCIGEAFAWTEGILALATIAQKFTLDPVDATIPQVEPLVTLRPLTPVRARLNARRR